jgi:hypothetical protein
MATALDVISRALRLIGSLDGGGVPTAEQAQDGLTALQAMLGEWETRGVRLGSVVDTTYTTASTIPVPITHVQALAFNLAVVIAPEYGAGAALQPIVPQAERAFRMLQAQYAKVPTIGADPAVTRQRGILNNAGYGEVGNSSIDSLASDTGPLYP